MVSYGSHAHKTFVRLVNVNSQNDIDEVKASLKLWKILLRRIMSA